jgi:hypothetical protein
MRKTDRKTENLVIKALTDACEIALARFEGFSWLTHLVNYQRFPASLTIVCVYETNAQLATSDREAMCTLIQTELASVGIPIKDIRRQVRFDTEENCNDENDGKWRERFCEFLSPARGRAI